MADLLPNDEGPMPRFSVAMTRELDAALAKQLDRGAGQEDLAFALWRPSRGRSRLTAILDRVVLPEAGDRVWLPNGTVAFTPQYVVRVLSLADREHGVAFLHSHLGPGWQGMSRDDVVAERKRMASATHGYTRLPLVGMTRATDGAWSARCWLPDQGGRYRRQDAESVRVVGRRLRQTFHPKLLPPPRVTAAHVATVSVWGQAKQAELARTRVGIVGLGSVGSIVAEALGRMGLTRLAFIDHDRIEQRNLDRTAGALPQDTRVGTPKVEVARRHVEAVHTADRIELDPFHGSLLSDGGLARVLDCDVLFSCVDRPAPRHVLNALAYAHLIPVVDGGTLAKVDEAGELIHADWRIHTVGPERACMVCLGALGREAITLDLAGKLDDPLYIQGLAPALREQLVRQSARQNVFPFSLSVAAHEVLQMVGLVTGEERVGGIGPQMYHCYPGEMCVDQDAACSDVCEYAALMATAADISRNFS